MAKKKPAFLERMAKAKGAEVMSPAVRGEKNTGMGVNPMAQKEMAERTVGKKRKKK